MQIVIKRKKIMKIIREDILTSVEIPIFGKIMYQANLIRKHVDYFCFLFET